MYKKLLQLPLFQGLNKETITDIISKVTLHFQTIPSQTVIVNQGESCNKLFFVLEGKLIKQTTSPDQSYRIEQLVLAPELIEPESLFGLSPLFKASYITQSSCNIMTIDKTFVLSELMNYSIFELNYLNILSRKVHTHYNLIWFTKNNTDLISRFEFFLLSHIEKNNRPTTLFITMEHLAFLLNDTRLNVSKMLNNLYENKIVSLKRKTIHIPNLNTLHLAINSR